MQRWWGSALVVLCFLAVNAVAINSWDVTDLDLAVDAPPSPWSPENWNLTQLSAPCERQLARISIEDPTAYRSMWHSWGRGLGDTGLFYDCTHTHEAKYCLATLDFSQVPNVTTNCNRKISRCNIGVCVPDQCDQADIGHLLGLIREPFLRDNQTANGALQAVQWVTNCQVDTTVGGNPRSWGGIAALILITLGVVIATAIHMLSDKSFGGMFTRVPVVIAGTDLKEKQEERKHSKEVSHQPSEQTSADDIELEVVGEADHSAEEVENFHVQEELDFIKHDPTDIIMDDEQPPESVHLLIDERESPEALIIGEDESSETVQVVDEGTSVFDQFSDLFPPGVVKIAECFSIPRNWNRLIGPIPGDFGSLNGLRFFSMLWVIWGHTLFFWAQIGASDMGYAYNTFVHQFIIQATMSGIFAVDSFFYLSGFLGAYFLYEHLLDGGRMEWVLIYFHRIWRILPVYSFVMLIYVTMIPVMGDGPFWFALKDTILRSSPYCWSNLLFINNYYPVDYEERCMGWGWFLAVDMQFFLISPLLIWIQYKKPILGWTLLSIWLVQDLTTSTVLSAVRGWSPSIVRAQEGFFQEFYQRPYCRASPYIIGMACGYLFSHIKRNHPNIRIPVVALQVGYAITFAVMSTIVFSIWWDDDWNQVENSIYLGFSRFGWGMCIAFLNMTMFLGYGGILRKFFFARAWQPLAKLTYGAYLSHPIFMFLYYYGQWDYIALENRNMWYFFFGHSICAFGFATLAYFLVEKPFMNLEPYLIKGFMRSIYKIRGKPLPKSLQ